MVLYVYIGDSVQTQLLKIINTPDVGYNYYTNLSNSGIILEEWNIAQSNGYGSVLTFFWYEKDFSWKQFIGSYEKKIKTYYENRLTLLDKIKQGKQESLWITYTQDVLGEIKSFWWDKKNKRYTIMGFSYTLE